MTDSPAAPTIAAGTVATATTQAVRSAGLRIRLRAMLPTSAPASSTMSRQKYATTATSVPRWSATSKVWLKASCCSRYVQSPSQGTRIRCPDDETGSSSVSPWTIPSTSACHSGNVAPSASPTSKSVRSDGEAEQRRGGNEGRSAAHAAMDPTV